MQPIPPPLPRLCLTSSAAVAFLTAPADAANVPPPPAGGAALAPPSSPPSDGFNFDALKSFVAGGIAGATAKTIIAPLDRMKILFQISNMRFSARAVVEELRRTVKAEGVPALFRGNWAQILRVYPYSGIQLMSFDRYSALIRKHVPAAPDAPAPPRGGPRRLTALEKLAAGACAGATSVTATYPLDLMRARLAVQLETPGLHPAHRHVSLRRAVATVYREHGLANFYRGMAPTLLGILPYAGISFSTFETLKQLYADEVGHEPTPLARLVCGGFAGVAGQAVTYPLDIARRRMQTEGFTPIHAHAGDAGAHVTTLDAGPPAAGAASSSHNHHQLHAVRQAGMLETLRRVVALEGWRGLFKGMSMNFIKGPVGIGVSFTSYDLLKKAWHIEARGHGE